MTGQFAITKRQDKLSCHVTWRLKALDHGNLGDYIRGWTFQTERIIQAWIPIADAVPSKLGFHKITSQAKSVQLYSVTRIHLCASWQNPYNYHVTPVHRPGKHILRDELSNVKMTVILVMKIKLSRRRIPVCFKDQKPNCDSMAPLSRWQFFNPW